MLEWPTPLDFDCEGRKHSACATISRCLTTVPSYLFVHLQSFQHGDSESTEVFTTANIFELDNAVPERGEPAGIPSTNIKADCVLTNRAERFERELQEATDFLEELVASSGMDTACRDAFETFF